MKIAKEYRKEKIKLELDKDLLRRMLIMLHNNFPYGGIDRRKPSEDIKKPFIITPDLKNYTLYHSVEQVLDNT